MKGEKWEIIRNSAEIYRKLPEDKQMFILGFMQGVLSSRAKKMKKNTKKSGEQTSKAFGEFCQLTFNNLEK